MDEKKRMIMMWRVIWTVYENHNWSIEYFHKHLKYTSEIYVNIYTFRKLTVNGARTKALKIKNNEWHEKIDEIII